ncbi:MAG: SCO family protein [Treponemataceae bacterium]|nr:SCO family protein [Treponemataceae bacterium]
MIMRFGWALLFFLPIWGVSLPALGEVGQGRDLDEKGRRYFTDLTVVTHEGREVRFYSDLLRNKVVVINFFYTNCPTAQVSLITLFKLQKMVGNQLGESVHFISLSVDPERDTLKAVQEYASRFNPKSGWVFLTGKVENLRIINMRLGNRNPSPEAHLQVFLLGNLKTGKWIRLPETAPPLSVAEGIRTLEGRE